MRAGAMPSVALDRPMHDLIGGQFTCLGSRASARRTGGHACRRVLASRARPDTKRSSPTGSMNCATISEFCGPDPPRGRPVPLTPRDRSELITPAEKRSSPMYNEFTGQVRLQADAYAGGTGRLVRARPPRNGCPFWTDGALLRAGGTTDKLTRIRSLLPDIRQANKVRRELVVAEVHAHADLTAWRWRTPRSVTCSLIDADPLPRPIEPRGACRVRRTVPARRLARCGPARRAETRKSARCRSSRLWMRTERVPRGGYITAQRPTWPTAHGLTC